MLEAYVFLLQLPYFLWLRNTWLLSEAGALVLLAPSSTWSFLQGEDLVNCRRMTMWGPRHVEGSGGLQSVLQDDTPEVAPG